MKDAITNIRLNGNLTRQEILVPKDFNLDDYKFMKSIGMTDTQIAHSWLWDESKFMDILKQNKI